MIPTIQALREALEKYGTHRFGCLKLLPNHEQCTCGLEEILALPIKSEADRTNREITYSVCTLDHSPKGREVCQQCIRIESALDAKDVAYGYCMREVNRLTSKLKIAENSLEAMIIYEECSCNADKRCAPCIAKSAIKSIRGDEGVK